MKKLLLTSAGFENKVIGEKFLSVINKKPEEIKVLFIPTAAITDDEKFYVGKCEEELLSTGIAKQNIFNYDLDYILADETLSQFDVIYVCGGTTKHLYTKMKDIDFDETIKKFLSYGKLYLGVSAGSIVVAKNRLSDETEMFSIVDLILRVHCESDITTEEEKSMGVIKLTDKQAVLCIDNTYTIIE